ncbi:hypothetical protein [Mycobacterium sp.]|uniref:hypothetical protein n=1 Tax=Mycobacterium sp. TaxID=1785 RepID=UPI003F97D1BD
MHTMRLHESRQRAREVVRMRGDGYSWSECASALGFSSRGAAERAFKRWHERLAHPDDPATDRRMLVESAKGDMWELTEGLRRAAAAGDDENVQRYATTKTRVRDQLARLQGAYAPERAEVALTASLDVPSIRAKALEIVAARADKSIPAMPTIDAEVVE